MFQKIQKNYDIKYMGHNVTMHKRGIYHNLNPSLTKHNIIFILIAIHEISFIDNLVFFTEKGEMIPQSSLDEKKHGFVMLATIQIKKEWQSKDIFMTEPRLQLVKNFYFNQIKPKHGMYHFGTSAQQIKSPDNIPKHINQDIIRK